MSYRPPGEERTPVCVACRLTPSEAAYLDEIAAAGGMTRSECVRSMLKAIFDDDKRAREGGMTQDWRKIEAAIADFLEREGLAVDRDADTIAATTCERHAFCELSVNVTKLARELADLK